MSAPEFSRPLDVRQSEGKALRLEANPAERSALARRFGLPSVDRLEADITLRRFGRAIEAGGRLWAEIVQSCAVSGEDLRAVICEALSFRFVPASERRRDEDEIELEAADCDEIEYDGTTFDIGEAIAQSLSLAIDPFATGPEADQVRQRVGLADAGASGPFAALAKLKKR